MMFVRLFICVKGAEHGSFPFCMIFPLSHDTVPMVPFGSASV